MAEDAKNELGALRAEYKDIVGKLPSPKFDAEALRLKIAEARSRGDQGEPEEAPEAPKGTALLDHDDQDASANVQGVEIVRGKNNLFLVPRTFVDHLTAHGFRVVSEAE